MRTQQERWSNIWPVFQLRMKEMILMSLAYLAIGSAALGAQSQVCRVPFNTESKLLESEILALLEVYTDVYRELRTLQLELDRLDVQTKPPNESESDHARNQMELSLQAFKNHKEAIRNAIEKRAEQLETLNTLDPRQTKSEDSRSGDKEDGRELDRRDEESLQGRWMIVHSEFSGKTQTRLIGREHIINGNEIFRPNLRTGVYHFELDPTTQPKQINLSAERLGNRILKGIYALNKDRLTICYAYDPALPGPESFDTHGAVRYLYGYERVKSSP